MDVIAEKGQKEIPKLVVRPGTSFLEARLTVIEIWAFSRVVNE